MEIKSAIESILFVSGEPMGIGKIAKILSVEKDTVKEAVKELAEDCRSQNRGVRILENNERVQMVSSSENAKVVEDLVKGDLRGDLSQAALETLAVVAYKGPVTRLEIDNIRGVNSGFMLRNLLVRGLIERTDNPNDLRSYLYKVSFDFIKKLGLEKMSDLPDYEEYDAALEKNHES